MRKYLGEKWEATDSIITGLGKKEARKGGEKRYLLIGQNFNSVVSPRIGNQRGIEHISISRLDFPY